LLINICLPHLRRSNILLFAVLSSKSFYVISEPGRILAERNSFSRSYRIARR
jgi:hypothetical protein